MLSTKCGQQTALVDNYKLEVEREKNNGSKYNEVFKQLESLRYISSVGLAFSDVFVISDKLSEIVLMHSLVSI